VTPYVFEEKGVESDEHRPEHVETYPVPHPDGASLDKRKIVIKRAVTLEPCPFTITGCDAPEETVSLRYDFTQHRYVVE
jgi:hypothetical protein